MTADGDEDQRVELKLRMGVIDTVLRFLGILAMLAITGTQTWMFSQIYTHSKEIMMLQERQGVVIKTLDDIRGQLVTNHDTLMRLDGKVGVK